MKKLNLILSFALLAIAFLSSCNKSKSPDVIVDFIGANSGWYGDTIKFDVTIDSKETFSLNITNDFNDDSFDDNYASGTATVTYEYIIPSGLAEGDKIKVSFVATNSESLLSTTVDKEITLSSGGSGVEIIHEGTITTDEIWSSNDIHIVEGTFNVSGCTLTIMPGTVVKMNQGAKIEVGNEPNSKLIAQGTADQTITFTSGLSEKNAGDWDYIWFDEGTLSSTILEYCTFEYGGGDNYYNFMFMVQDCEININNCTFRHSASMGIKSSGISEFNSFNSNTLESCASYLISIYPNAVNSLGNSSSYTATDFGILINANASGSFTLPNSTWYKQDVPYYLNYSLEIGADQGATLIIEAGTTIKMMSETNIEVGYSEEGSLIAEGTASEPITFSSASANVNAGDWEYIWLGQYSMNTSSLEYCSIEYAGGDNYYDFALRIDNTQASVNNCTITNSASSGIELTNGGAFASFTNNTINNCVGYLIEIQPNAIHSIGSDNILSNSENGVLISDYDYTLTTEHTWPALSCSYVIDDQIDIGTDNGGGAILRIAPGANFKMKDGASLDIGSSSATVYFEGTSTNPINFTTGYTPAQAGQWNGIYFFSDVLPGSVMDYVNVNYGGADSYYKGNIVISGTTNIEITNCNISNSETYGIYLRSSGLPSNADWQTVNTFSNNALGNWN
ncbi:MAG: hypothetical protein JXL97_01665 [Bacteroidales bacterium]|nr:hypothetical protein [Bacteroidales bacterium]